MLLLATLSSSQAQTWSTSTVPAAVPVNLNNVFNSIAYNGTKFVASGLELHLVSSTDGVNWNYDGRMSTATVASVFDLTWIPHLSKWVAPSNVNVNVNAVIYTSTDGISWSPTNSGIPDGVVNNFATDGTTVIGTVNISGRLVKSTNLSTWTIQTLGISGIGSLFSIIYVPSTGKWVAVGGGGGIITSPDGTTWTKQTGPTNITGIIRTVAYGNGRYVVGAGASGRAGWSTDGVTWNNSSTGLASSGLTRMTFVNGVFVAVGTLGAIITSPDGTTWSAAHNSGTGENISDVVANGTGSSAKVVAVGGSTTPLIRNIDASLLNVAATAPEIAVTEAGVGDISDNTGTFSFGTTTVGTPVTKTFTITNSGDANLTLSNLSLPAGFSLAATFGSTTVAGSGGTTTFQITMSASAAGAPSGTLSFDNNDATENPFNFTISGTVNPAPVAVSSLVRGNSSPTRASTIPWNLTFSSPVTGLGNGNFSLSGPAAVGSSVVSVTTAPSGLQATISVSTGGTDGELTLTLVNATGLSAPLSNTPFTGQSYTIDKTPPTVLSVVRFNPSGQTTNNPSVVFRVTYSEAVTGVAAGRFAVVPVGGSNIVGSISGVTPVSAGIYDIGVNVTSGTGEFRLRVLD